MHPRSTSASRSPDGSGPGDPDPVVVTVGAVTHGGACVARHAGRVVFVRHTLPGERVRVRITERRSGYWRGDAVEVLEASAQRVRPRCVLSGPGGCGGCDWQHASVPAQLDGKRELLQAALRRVGVSGAVVDGVQVRSLPGGPLGWRTRVEFAVDARGRPGLREHRSHRIVPVAVCPLSHPGVQSLGLGTRFWPGASSLRAVASGQGDRTVVVRYPDGHQRRRGPEQVREGVFGSVVSVPAGAFWQAHPRAAEALVERVLALLQVSRGEQALDLYSGVGLFAGALARAGARVRAVESDPQAARAARFQLAGLGVQVLRGRAEHLVGRLRPPSPDLVVLDPPRAGAAPPVLRYLAQCPARVVVYVSCDPSTLARDLAHLTGAGWRLTDLEGIDAFPMTAHLECVAALAR